MTKARNLSDLLDATGDVVSSALDNVPPSDNASSLTTGTLPIARIADGDITLAKLSATGTPSSSTFLRGDNTWQGGGKVLQVVTATTTTTTSTTSTSFVTTALSVAITPSSTSNKVLIFTTSGTFYNQVVGYGCIATLYRDTTELSGVSYGLSNTWSATARIQVPAVIGFYDTPSSVSSITYSLRIKSENASGTAVHLPNNDLARIIAIEIAG